MADGSPQVRLVDAVTHFLLGSIYLIHIDDVMYTPLHLITFIVSSLAVLRTIIALGYPPAYTIMNLNKILLQNMNHNSNTNEDE